MRTATASGARAAAWGVVDEEHRPGLVKQWGVGRGLVPISPMPTTARSTRRGRPPRLPTAACSVRRPRRGHASSEAGIIGRSRGCARQQRTLGGAVVALRDSRHPALVDGQTRTRVQSTSSARPRAAVTSVATKPPAIESRGRRTVRDHLQQLSQLVDEGAAGLGGRPRACARSNGHPCQASFPAGAASRSRVAWSSGRSGEDAAVARVGVQPARPPSGSLDGALARFT